jgi:predicted GNAT superfamily acetyltransferase
MRIQVPELVERWRRAGAMAFTTLFALGFEAVDFLRTRTNDRPRSFYVLRRKRSPRWRK